MKKKLWIIGAVAVVAAVAYYLLSPLWRVKEVDEASPLETASRTSPSAEIKDALDTMDAAMKEAFNKEMEVAKHIVMVKEDAMLENPTLLARGDFRPRAHDVKGRALLITQGNRRILRFEDFETINGPKLNIYLAKDVSNDDIIDLGEIRATKGNVNYEVPAGTDTTAYNKVLVWCVRFGILFSYAELTESSS